MLSIAMLPCPCCVHHKQRAAHALGVLATLSATPHAPMGPPVFLQLSEALRDAKLLLLKELQPDQPEEAAAAAAIVCAAKPLPHAIQACHAHHTVKVSTKVIAISLFAAKVAVLH
jgi:hypothetical protein